MKGLEIARLASIDVDLDDYSESSMYRGTYEQGETSLPARFVRPGGCCVDAGANIGLYTVLLAALTGPDGTVLAFEPSHFIRERLLRNMAGLPQVKVFPCALGARPETATLFRWEGDAAIARLQHDLHHAEPIEETVAVQRLDDVPEARNAEQIDFLKVDVNGSEAEIFAGATELFEHKRVRAAVVGQIAPVAKRGSWIETLEEAGYAAFTLLMRPTTTRLRRTLRLLQVATSPSTVLDWKILFVRRDLTHLVADLVEGLHQSTVTETRVGPST
jgi:FkbM family methyltransferase